MDAQPAALLRQSNDMQSRAELLCTNLAQACVIAGWLVYCKRSRAARACILCFRHAALAASGWHKANTAHAGVQGLLYPTRSSLIFGRLTVASAAMMRVTHSHLSRPTSAQHSTAQHRTALFTAQHIMARHDTTQ